MDKILRELNKAFVAYKKPTYSNVNGISTGKWGCGVFNGNV